MIEKIMFRGHEVVEAKEIERGSCVGCVAYKNGCHKLSDECLEHNTIYVYAPPPVDVFIETPTVNCAYFACSIGKANIASGIYSSRRAAIRGATRFCAKIGFTCRIKEAK